MKRHLAIVLCLLLAVAPVADACSCAPPPPPKESLAKSVAVFSGKCVGIMENGENRVCTFEVDRVWKGDIGAKVVITTGPGGGMCGFNFTTDGAATYLVYATGKPDALSTNICTRTASLGQATDDLKELGEGKKPQGAK